jgi:hypothetical protein
MSNIQNKFLSNKSKLILVGLLVVITITAVAIIGFKSFTNQSVKIDPNLNSSLSNAISSNQLSNSSTLFGKSSSSVLPSSSSFVQSSITSLISSQNNLTSSSNQQTQCSLPETTKNLVKTDVGCFELTFEINGFNLFKNTNYSNGKNNKDLLYDNTLNRDLVKQIAIDFYKKIKDKIVTSFPEIVFVNSTKISDVEFEVALTARDQEYSKNKDQLNLSNFRFKQNYTLFSNKSGDWSFKIVESKSSESSQSSSKLNLSPCNLPQTQNLIRTEVGCFELNHLFHAIYGEVSTQAPCLNSVLYYYP